MITMCRHQSPQLQIPIDTLYWSDLPEGVVVDDSLNVSALWFSRFRAGKNITIPIQVTPSQQYPSNWTYLRAELSHPPVSAFWKAIDSANLELTAIFPAGIQTVLWMYDSIYGDSSPRDEHPDYQRLVQNAKVMYERHIRQLDPPHGLWDNLKLFLTSLFKSFIQFPCPEGEFIDENLPLAGAGLVLYMNHFKELENFYYQQQGMIPPEPTQGRRQMQVGIPIDPNCKAGSAGFGNTGYVPPYEQFHYIVYFENVDTATAPAEDIVIIDTLDNDLDWTTFAFDTSSHIPTNQTFDPNTGVVTWTFEDINLPPNVNPPEGEGWVSFTINPKQDLTTGTEIKNRAWIVFDFNEPMATPEVLNTIDAGPPSSNIIALPETTRTAEFTVQWSGNDDYLGSGIRNYDVYVKIDDGDFIPWLTGVTETTAIFVCRNEGTHYFYSIATDNVGWRENPPENPDEFTVVTDFPRWAQKESIIIPHDGRSIKDGGALVGVGSDLYAFRGTKTKEFKMYSIGTKSGRVDKETIPFGYKYPVAEPPKIYKKYPGKGAALCYDGVNTIYATKGNGTKEFWSYSVSENTWTAESFVPVPKGLKGGTSMQYRDGKVYLLAGSQKKTDLHNFFVFDVSTKTWTPLCSLELGSYTKVWKDGSSIILCGDTLYALKGGDKNNLFYAYDFISNTCAIKETMPIWDSLYGKYKKKLLVKDGGATASDGEVIYAIKGGGKNVFWKYTPGTPGVWLMEDSIPRLNKKSVPKTGAALAYADGAVWLLKGNKTPEFWRYIPSEEDISKTISNIMTEQNITIYLFMLYQNKPNPFKSQTAIRYSLPTKGKVTLQVYDVTGRIVKTLINEDKKPGIYNTIWNGTDNRGTKVSQGVYFYTLKADGQKIQKKMLLLK
jgi:hypothetical protein